MLINEWEKDNRYYKKLTKALSENNLAYISTPCHGATFSKCVIGLYLNYIQVGKNIFLPIFDCAADEKAILFFENVFCGHKVIPVNSKQVARVGGVLWCVSWGIKL